MYPSIVDKRYGSLLYSVLRMLCSLEGRRRVVDTECIFEGVEAYSVDEMQPSMDEMQPNMDEMQPSVDEMQPSVDEMQPTLDEMYPTLIEMQPR
jgi:hypothetical protein